MISELFPLERLIIVDIDLSEELNQLLDKLRLVRVLRAQVVEHDLEELLEAETVVLALAKVLLDFLQLAIVQITHDIFIVFVLVQVRIVYLLLLKLV